MSPARPHRRAPTEQEIANHLLPAMPQVQRAAAIIKAQCPFAATDRWPADIAAPTGLYLGAALMVLWPDTSPRFLAEVCRICPADCFEFFELVELAARSEWINLDIVAGVIVVLGEAPPAPQLLPAPRMAVESADAATKSWQLPAAQACPAPPPRLARVAQQVITTRAMAPAPLPRVTIPPRSLACDDPYGPVALIDLRHDSCRWPLGDPRDAGMMFCGQRQALGSSYCPEHRQRARGQAGPA